MPRAILRFSLQRQCVKCQIAKYQHMILSALLSDRCWVQVPQSNAVRPRSRLSGILLPVLTELPEPARARNSQLEIGDALLAGTCRERHGSAGFDGSGIPQAGARIISPFRSRRGLY